MTNERLAFYRLIVLLEAHLVSFSGRPLRPKPMRKAKERSPARGPPLARIWPRRTNANGVPETEDFVTRVAKRGELLGCRGPLLFRAADGELQRRRYGAGQHFVVRDDRRRVRTTTPVVVVLSDDVT